MYVNFSSTTTDQFDRLLANMLGCLNPNDVSFAGGIEDILITDPDGNTYAAYLVPGVPRILLISTKGVALAVKYYFPERMCEIFLLYASSSRPLDDGDEETATYEATFETAVRVKLPYLVVPSGS